MDREQFKRLIEMAESQHGKFKTPRPAGLNEHFLDEAALNAAREELAKWPTEDEIDETPRIRPEDAEKYIPRS